MRWINVACTSAPRVARCMRLPTPVTRGPRLSTICRPWYRWRLRPCHDVATLRRALVIRVVLPAHLRTLARLGNEEVKLELSGPPTVGAVLDAIEASYPVLR